jgi:predicted enzyme related to lactoylglutathione lyase
MKSFIQIAELVIAALLAGCAAVRQADSPQPAAPGPKRVTGIGGIFFKCKDPKATREWYAVHLGLQTDEYGTNFEWRQAEDGKRKGFTQWGPFPENTTYYEPSHKDFMINYRVENLEWLIEQLRKEHVTIVDKIEVFDYGKCCHIMDPDGNKIELWEPNDVVYETIVGGRTK